MKSRTNQCSAKSRQTGKRCGQWCTPGMTTCHWHGGKSLRGVASPAFRHGRYVKDLPTQLLSRYEEARTDPELISLGADVALVDSRIGELIDRLKVGLEQGPAWSDARALWAKVMEARAAGAGKAGDLKAALEALGAVIERGVPEAQLWAELTDALYLRKKLVDSESRRLKNLHQMLTLDKVRDLVAALTESVRRHVTDRAVLNAIQGDFARLLSLPERGTVVVESSL